MNNTAGSRRTRTRDPILHVLTPPVGIESNTLKPTYSTRCGRGSLYDTSRPRNIPTMGIVGVVKYSVGGPYGSLSITPVARYGACEIAKHTD